MRLAFLVAAFFFLSVFHAFAAATDPSILAASPVVNNTTVDLGPLVQDVIAFLGIVLPAIAGYIAWLTKQRMNIQQDSSDALKIDTAAKRAGGIALDFIKQVMPVNPTIQVRDAAVAQGLNHVVASLPDAVSRIGVTTETLTRMVNSELTQLEHVTPVAAVPAQVTTLTPGEQVVFTPVPAPVVEPIPVPPIPAPPPAP